jgi:hypothetical protein
MQASWADGAGEGNGLRLAEGYSASMQRGCQPYCCGMVKPPIKYFPEETRTHSLNMQGLLVIGAPLRRGGED